MDFSFQLKPSLPRQAWCAHLKNKKTIVTVFHGAGVEINEHAFSEGAWNGSFSEQDFIESTVMCGTGGKIEKGQVFFTGSTDRLSPIVSIQNERGLFVSNSVLLIFSISDEEPNPIYPYYAYDLVRIWRQGLYCLDGRVPLLSGAKLSFHFGGILQVDTALKVQLETRSPGLEPTDFASFKNTLETETQEILQNAADPARKFPFGSISALSKGYDSTAATALACKAGCVETFSFIDSRQKNQRLDSGIDNAKRWGMSCVEVDRWEYLNCDSKAIVELSLFALSPSSPMAACEDVLKGKIFVSGHFGDSMLGLNKSACFDNHAQAWPTCVIGVGVMEFRLRVGYLSFAPFMILSRHNQAIHRITHSKEMKPWSVGGDYDRPMARRIIEEAGLPRGSFAVKKWGGSHAQFQIYKKNTNRSKGSEAYLGFMEHFHQNVPRSKLYYWKLRTQVDYKIWSKIGPKRKAPTISTPMQRQFPFIVNAPPRKLDWNYMFSMQWAHHTLKSNYQLK